MADRQPEKLNKRERTRLKVIEAAIDCLYSEGFHNANTNRIAEQAGVSWGVLQYHFGDKDGLLQAVLDHIFERFQRRLDEASTLNGSVEERIRALVALVWSLVSQPEYRVSIAILRNAGKARDSRIDGQNTINTWGLAIAQLWGSIFPHTGGPHHNTAKRIMFATLRGLADEINPVTDNPPSEPAAELDTLCTALVYLIRQQEEI